MCWLVQREMTMRSVLWVAAFIYALYLPLALWISHSYVPRPMPPEPRWQLLRFEPVEGVAFRSRPHQLLRHFEDDQPAAQRSPVILYEDDKPMGPAHSLHHDVEYVGNGRY